MSYNPTNPNGQATMANSSPVVIASDQLAFPITLSAETTKVIGVTRTADGSGNLLTSTSNALDVNLKSGTSTLALDTTLTGGTQQTKITNGTNIAAVKASSTAAGATDPALVVGLSPNSALPAGSNAIGKLAANSGVVIGDVNINGTPSVNATLATETTKVIGVTRSADGSGNLLTSTSNALDVNIKSGSSGTQYADGAARGTATGTLLMVDDSTNIQSVSGDTSGRLNVNVVSAPSTTVTATNLSTNVAQFGGNNVATGTGTSGSGVPRVTVSTDSQLKLWDGTTGVNVIAGTNALKSDLSSIAGTATDVSSGNTSNGTQRVVLASNQPVLAGVGAGSTSSAPPANAVYSGGLAGTSLTTASAGNLTGMMVDKFGRQVILNNSIRELSYSKITTLTATTTETAIMTTSPTASTWYDLIAVMVSNTSASAVQVDIRDSLAASNVVFTLYIPAGDVRGITLTTPWPQTGVAGTSYWTAKCQSSVSSVVISALFVLNK